MRLSRAKLKGSEPSGNAERYRLFATLGGLYLAQGIPTYLIAAALPPVLREAGVSRSAIGFFSLLMLPLVLKFLWAPFIDRFRFLKIGHRRGWIVPMQLVTASGIAVLAFVEPTDLTGLFVVCMVMALAMSVQDIATDGYATNSLSEKDRGIGNAFQGGAVAFGVVIGGTLSLVLFETCGWTPTLLFVATLSLLPLAVTPMMRERPMDNEAQDGEATPKPKPSLRAFFMRPEAVQIFVIALVFRASEGLVKAMEGPYLVDVGLPLSWIGYLSGGSAATAGIIGSAIAVVLIRWQGANRSLIILGLLRTLCFAAFALHALGIYEALWTVMSAAAFQTFIRYMEIVILYSIFMGVASKSQPGTDFTLLACAQLIVYLIGSSLSGMIADQFGYGSLFMLAAILSGLAVLSTLKLLPQRPSLETSAAAPQNEATQATTTVSLVEPDTVLQALLDHLKGHNLASVDQSDGSVLITLGEESQIRISSEPRALAFCISAPSANKLFLFKEGVVRHLEEIVPEATASIHWSDDLESRSSSTPTSPPNFHLLQVASKTEPFPGMLRLTLAGKASTAALQNDGIHVKLMIPSDPESAPSWPHVASNGATLWPKGEDELHVRYYTLKEVRSEENEVDIDIVRHQGGKIADWAEKAVAGDAIGLMGPGGGETIPCDCKSVLLAADETALPALAHILENLQQGCSGHVVVALPEDKLNYLPKTDLTITYLPSEIFADQVEKTLRTLVGSSIPDFCWFAGEHDNAQSLRKLFKQDFSLGKGRQFAISYWKRGHSGDAKGIT